MTFPHEPGTLSDQKRTSSATGQRRINLEPQQAIKGSAAGVDPNTGELLVARDGGSLVRASSSGNALPGMPAQLTLGSGSQKNRRAIASFLSQQVQLTSSNGAVENPDSRFEEGSTLDCDLPTSVSFNVNNNADDQPPDDDPPADQQSPDQQPPADPEEQEDDELPNEAPEAPEEQPATWGCDRNLGKCVPVPNGIYASQAECEAAGCSQQTWNCGPDGTCVQVNGTGGQFATLEACQASGCEQVGWSCISGVCTEEVGGTFSTLEECYASNCLTCRAYTVTVQYDRFGSGCQPLPTVTNNSVRTGTGFSVEAVNPDPAPCGVQTYQTVRLEWTDCSGLPQQANVASATNLRARNATITNIQPFP